MTSNGNLIADFTNNGQYILPQNGQWIDEGNVGLDFSDPSGNIAQVLANAPEGQDVLISYEAISQICGYYKATNTYRKVPCEVTITGYAQDNADVLVAYNSQCAFGGQLNVLIVDANSGQNVMQFTIPEGDELRLSNLAGTGDYEIHISSGPSNDPFRCSVNDTFTA